MMVLVSSFPCLLCYLNGSKSLQLWCVRKHTESLSYLKYWNYSHVVPLLAFTRGHSRSNSVTLTGWQVLSHLHYLPSLLRCPLKNTYFIFNHEYVCMTVCGYVNMSAGTCESQKRASYLAELEFQRILSHLNWVLEIELSYCAGSVSILNHWGFSPAPYIIHYPFKIKIFSNIAI